MKISDLIRKLEILKKEHGDNELLFFVKDYYSLYGEQMSFTLNVGEKGEGWSGMNSHHGITNLHFGIKDNYEGKHPKITFRK